MRHKSSKRELDRDRERETERKIWREEGVRWTAREDKQNGTEVEISDCGREFRGKKMESSGLKHISVAREDRGQVVQRAQEA